VISPAAPEPERTITEGLYYFAARRSYRRQGDHRGRLAGGQGHLLGSVSQASTYETPRRHGAEQGEPRFMGCCIRVDE
jgi:hypothetical protein